MSGTNDRTYGYRTPWNGSSAPPLPVTGFLNSSDGLLLPQVQPQQQVSGLLPHNHFSTPQPHGALPGESNVSDGGFAMPAQATSSIASESTAAQGNQNPSTTTQTATQWSSASSSGAVDNTVANRPSRKPRVRQPSDAHWQQHKAHMKKLYMDENRPLSEVVQLMGEYNFVATERMYKNKFKAWRWSKNLPQEKAAWMIRKAQEIRPQKTVFHWNNQEWTEEKLSQRLGTRLEKMPAGSLANCAPTPSDIGYDTPRVLATSPQQRQPTAAQLYASVEKETERPQFCLDSLPVNFDLSRITLSDLRKLLDQASSSASDGEVDKAEGNLRDVVAGFSRLLSPTHEETLRAGYTLASFYANCSNMTQADEVLNWMSKKQIEKWGSGDENTYLHYARMIELFRSWGRQEHAELLVYKILDDTETVGETPLIDFQEGRPTTRDWRSVADLGLGHSLNGPVSSEVMGIQLDKLELAIMSNISGLDDVLETIVRHCEDKPGDPGMSLQACRAKCSLAKLHMATGRDQRTRQILKSAMKSLTPLLVVGHDPLPRTTVQVARRLSCLYLEAGDESSCNAVLDQVIASLEARRYMPNFEQELENTFLLDFVLSIAFEFHASTSWDKCRYWVERGLGISIRIHGRKSPEAHRFQKILDNKDFNMRTSKSVSDLMNCTGGLFSVRIVSNPALL